jgi:hypothetical protein
MRNGYVEPLPSRDRKGAFARMRYLIIFACYGAHLHGDERGSVDRFHNVPGGRLLPADTERFPAKRQRMRE